jgi:photosystem II stability/assembly factor-like uncharacterized protein
MRGDYSRLRFRPRDHYSSVRLQQGRVQLDADWNELVDIQAHRDQETTIDVVGRSGVPLDGGGFGLATGHFLRGLSFHSDTEGVAVGEDGTILPIATAGGAETWGAPENVGGVGAHLNAVHMLSATDGWAVGDGGQVLRRDASGWSQPGSNPAAVDLLGVHSPESATGWAVGDGGTILKRTGATWAPQPAPGVGARLRDVFALSATRAWIVGDGATILTTADGAAWTRQQAPARTGNLHAVFFLTDGAERGWAVGEGATILRTADGGAKWERVPAPAGLTASLRAVAFRSAQHGVAAGDDGTVLVTADGGATWALSGPAPRPGANLRAVDVRGAGARAAGDELALASDASLGSWTARALPGSGRTLTISAGDAYLDGIRTVNERKVSFGGQPDAPGAKLPAGAAATFGAYLRVAEHHVTATERDELREVALGGPDTTTRTQTTWQVRLSVLTGGDTCLVAAAALPSAGGDGRLRARAQPGAEPAGECIVPPEGGYRRLENQLYRVEILRPGDNSGTGTAATFTWSRDNGSVLSRLVAIDHDRKTVTVDEVRDDEVLGLAPKQFVEISDEGRALNGKRGIVAEIKAVKGTVIELEALEPHPAGAKWTMADFPLRPTVRRWDGSVVAKPGWMALEEGVEIELDGGRFSEGDFWTIPARTLSGDVAWRRAGHVPLFEERDGERVRFASLGVVKRDAAGHWTVTRDCRRRFPPLTGLIGLQYVGGDGQEVKTDLTLPSQRTRLSAPLEVRVANGRTPVADAVVRFRLAAFPSGGPVAGGLLSSPLPGTVPATAATEITVPTGADGIARAFWDIAGDVQVQHVEATLVLDEPSPPPQPTIRFTAQRGVAAEVAYDPGTCKNLAPAKDVQAAIGTLARVAHFDAVEGDGQEVMAQSEMQPLRVRVVNSCGPVNGARVQFSVSSGGGTVTPTGVVTTGADGLATCAWTLGDSRGTQVAQALLIDDGSGAGTIDPAPVARFTANLSRADHVSYVPRDGCAVMAGATTVKTALDRLVNGLRLYAAGGDGATAGEGATVRLVARLWDLCGPADGKVRFAIAVGNGSLSDTGPIQVDAEGRAGVDFVIGSGVRHEIVATVVRPDDETQDLPVAPVVFTVTRAAGGACTVTAASGGDLQGAVDALPAGGGELCLGAGLFELEEPVVVKERRRITITGRGPATVIRIRAADAAFIFMACAGVRVRNLRVEAGDPANEIVHRDGALTFLGCSGIDVCECELACAAGPERARSCVNVRPPDDFEPVDEPVEVAIERNRLEVGAWQAGVVVVDAEQATVAGNDVRLGDRGARDLPDFGVFLAPDIVAAMLAAAVRRGTAGSREVRFPGRDDVVALPGDSPFLTLWREVAERTSEDPRFSLRQALEGALRRFGLREWTGESARLLVSVARQLAVAQQGIVVGGERLGTVRVLDNVLQDVAQGIHVAVAQKDQEEPALAREVLVSRNVVHGRVPAGSRRQRHAILVSNANSVTVADTVATLARSGGSDELSPVPGVVVQGRLGPFLTVRQTSLRDFTTGVAVQPTADPDPQNPPARMWLVAETMAAGGQVAVVAPSTVDEERNVVG